MLMQIQKAIADTSSYPDFIVYYQDYIKQLQDDIIDYEVHSNEKELLHFNSFNSVRSVNKQLNELTEELKLL